MSICQYDPFIIANVVYQVVYIPYPWGFPRSHVGHPLWRTNPDYFFQEEVMNSSAPISKSLPQNLVESGEDEEADDDDKVKEDDLKTGIEDDDEHIQYQSDDDEDSEDNDDVDGAIDG